VGSRPAWGYTAYLKKKKKREEKKKRDMLVSLFQPQPKDTPPKLRLNPYIAI
jgi:hypothetical protein